MRVFLDSNVILATGKGLDTQGFRKLREFADREDVELITSIVVVEEVTNAIHRHLGELIDRARASLQKLNRTAKQSFSVDVTDQKLAEWTAKYREQLVALFEETGGCILPYPEISHEEVTNRAIRGSKPFGGNKDGYRDYLIWQSVLDAVRMIKDSGLEVLYFGTDNKLDFARPKSNPVTLHSDFVDDLLSHDFLEDDVILFGSLGDIMANQVAYQLAELTHAKSRIQRLWKRGGLNSSVEGAIEIYLQHRPESAFPLQRGWDEYNVEEVHVVEYQDVRVEIVQDGFISAEVDAVCDCVLSFDDEEDVAFPSDWTVERIERPWGRSHIVTVSIAATIGLVFDSEQQHFSTAVWQADPMDMEFLYASS